MERRAVIGVKHSAATTEPAPVEAAPVVGFETGVSLAVAVTGALALARWLFVGGPGIGFLLLVPFWFVSAPVVLWLCGHGVVYWDKHESEFLAVDAVARPWLAKFLLGFFAVSSVVFAVMFLRIEPPCGT
ncbi:MAG: hypothetical protein JNK15_21220 [Planctomycetes bacterium]|nr:hypothetical protein [Planctomycetota bacterium]